MRRRVLAGLISLALAGCAQPERVAVDLVATFPTAEAAVPTHVLDLGDPAAVPHQVRGWLDVTRTIDDGTGRGAWSMGDGAELDLFLPSPGPRGLVLRCAPAGDFAGSSMRLGLALNGQPWTDLEIRPGLDFYRLEAPAELLRRGENRLGITHPPPPPGPRTANRDVRVLWDSVRVEGVAAHLALPRKLEEGWLYLPSGTRLDYYLALPAGARLVVDAVRRRGDGGGALEVAWEPLDGERRVLAEDLAAKWRQRSAPVELVGEGRLSLFAVPEDGKAPDPAAGFVLVRPRVVAGDGDAPVTAAPPPVAPPAGPPPDVVVYLVDTLRADRLGVYGYDRGTSPALDAFAKDAVVFDGAQAQSPWTRASVASLFTGLWPAVHGAEDDPDVLAEGVVTLADALRDAGYETAAFVANGNTTRQTGFAQGFDHFVYLEKLRAGEPIARSEDVNAAVFAFLAERRSERPLFLYVHTVDPHAPYDPTPPFRARFAPEVADPETGSIARLVDLSQGKRPATPEVLAELGDLYDAEVAANDESFGALVTELRRVGLFDDTLIVFLSDHGEELYEHGDFQHGKSLYAEVLDVPWVMRLPGGHGGGRRMAFPAEHVDLMPTVLELAGAKVPGGLQGRSLLSVLAGEAPPREQRQAVAQMNLRGKVGSSLLRDAWKVIVRLDGPKRRFPELYDRGGDPGESRNLAPERTVTAKLLAVVLRALEAAESARYGAGELDDEARRSLEENLRALGYLGP